MNGIAVLVTLAVVGVDYGWQPSSDGELEYIIQIDPKLLDSMKNGAEIASTIHPDARGVRRFRIKVGTEPLPRKGSLQSSTAPTRLSTSEGSTFPTDRSGISAPAAAAGAPLDPAPPGIGASSYPAGSTPLTDEFGTDGFLNLPPPPAIGMDGKSSVLVRPGSRGSGWGDDTGRSSVGVPPLLDRIAPPAPPDTDSLNLNGPVRSDAAPDDQRDVRPVPAPSNEYGAPTPILGAGRSEVLPPAATTKVSEILPPNWHVLQESTVENSDHGTEPARKDLLAAVADHGAAMQKPTLGQQEAEELRELERQAEPAKPWKTLVLTSLALFASLAANVYLGWVALGIYRRYRDVVGQLHRFQASLT